MGRLKIKKFNICEVCRKKVREKKMLRAEIAYDGGMRGYGSFRYVCSEECLEILRNENPECEVTVI